VKRLQYSTNQKISSIHRNEHQNINKVNRQVKREVNDTVKASE